MKLRIGIVLGLAAWPFLAKAEALPASVGRPLQQAEALIQKHEYRAALAKVGEVEKTGHLSAYEQLVIAQIRGIAAAGAGDYADAAAAYETVLNSGTQPAAADLQYIQAIAGFYYQAKNYDQAIAWVQRYEAAGGSDPRTLVLAAQSYFAQGDYAKAAQAAARDAKTARSEGHVLPEAELQLWASSAEKSGDQAGYAAALDALLKAYPAPQYWAEAIALLTASPEFPDRLTLDVYRLRWATGTLTAPEDYEDYAERAILAGAPAEAQAVMEKGFAAGILTDQTDGGHAARLRALAAKDAAAKPAATAIQQAKAGGRTPDAELDLGVADAEAGQTQAALAAFRNVIAASPPADSPAAGLARLWSIYLENSARR